MLDVAIERNDQALANFGLKVYDALDIMRRDRLGRPGFCTLSICAFLRGGFRVVSIREWKPATGCLVSCDALRP